MVEPQARDVEFRGLQLNPLSAILARLRVWLKKQFIDRVVWVSGQPRALRSGTSQSAPWIAIFGREHYDVSIHRLPIRGWLDARRAADFMRFEGEWSVSVVGDWDGVHRSVAFYRFNGNAWQVASSVPFWFFETQLLSLSLPNDQVCSVERFGFRYFLAPPERSQVAGSLISDPALFALSVGASEQSISQRIIDASAIVELLFQSLFKLRPRSWIQAVNRDFLTRLSAVASPATRLFVVFFAAYLVCSTSYLWVLKSIREQQVRELGPEVAVLLDTQRKVDALSREVNAVTSIVNSRVDSYQAWSLVPAVWDSGGVVFGVASKDGRVIIRGATVDATSLLSAISKNPSFDSARFDSPVRESSGRQDFSIGVGLPEAKTP